MTENLQDTPKNLEGLCGKSQGGANAIFSYKKLKENIADTNAPFKVKFASLMLMGLYRLRVGKKISQEEYEKKRERLEREKKELEKQTCDNERLDLEIRQEGMFYPTILEKSIHRESLMISNRIASRVIALCRLNLNARYYGLRVAPQTQDTTYLRSK
jgi:hypothetical protein